MISIDQMRADPTKAALPFWLALMTPQLDTTFDPEVAEVSVTTRV
jgi:hypothetical protein